MSDGSKYSFAEWARMVNEYNAIHRPPLSVRLQRVAHAVGVLIRYTIHKWLT